jgi:hypothetical protein
MCHSEVPEDKVEGFDMVFDPAKASLYKDAADKARKQEGRYRHCHLYKIKL